MMSMRFLFAALDTFPCSVWMKHNFKWVTVNFSKTHVINLNDFPKVLTAEDVIDKTPKIDAGEMAQPGDFI